MVSDFANLFCSFVVRTAKADLFFGASCLFCFTDSQ